MLDSFCSILEAGNKTNREPTEAQIRAGNYRKRSLNIYGLNISVENEKGSYRSGVDPTGEHWRQKMNCVYGYIRGTVGKDKDHIDVFVGSKDETDSIFVVDQTKDDGSFDEHKCIFGAKTKGEALKIYLSNYKPNWNKFSNVTEIPVEDFKKWVVDNKKTKKPAVESYSSISESFSSLLEIRSGVGIGLPKVKNKPSVKFGMKVRPRWPQLVPKFTAHQGLNKPLYTLRPEQIAEKFLSSHGRDNKKAISAANFYANRMAGKGGAAAVNTRKAVEILMGKKPEQIKEKDNFSNSSLVKANNEENPRIEALKFGKVIDHERLGEGISGSNVSYKTNIEGFGNVCFKPISGEGEWMDEDITGTAADREAACYEVASAMGFDEVPMTIVRKVNGEKGSVQEWVLGEHAEIGVDVDIFGDGLTPEMKKLNIKMDLFDGIVSNLDRNMSNVLLVVKNNSKIVTELRWIDNGLSFTDIGHDQKYCEGLAARMLAHFKKEEVEKVASGIEAVLKSGLFDELPKKYSIPKEAADNAKNNAEAVLKKFKSFL